MKAFTVLAMAGVAVALPQGVTSAIAPKEATPSGCSSSYPSPFAISLVNVTTNEKRSFEKRADKVLTITLANGVLTDDQGRTGYIAANNQFQFDKPAQTGAIFTSGFSVCSNGTLALGESAVFYQCLSGTFYNIYDESTGAQCSQVYVNVLSGGASASGALSQIGDGQVTGSAVTQLSDGQVQATTSPVAPVTQISDGQVQASTGTPVAAPVTQIADGQIQANTAAVTAAPVTQISDGQIQGPTGKPVAAPVTQISDGQIQAPRANGTMPAAMASPTIAQFVGAGSVVRVEALGLIGALVAALL